MLDKNPERAGGEGASCDDEEFARRFNDTVTGLAKFAGVPSANSRIQFMSALMEWWRWFAREAGGRRLDKVRSAALGLAAKISRLKFDLQGKDAAATLEAHEAWGGAAHIARSLMRCWEQLSVPRRASAECLWKHSRSTFWTRSDRLRKRQRTPRKAQPAAHTGAAAALGSKGIPR
jgi:hypothetical protein